MIIQEINGQRVGTPTEQGNYLCNENAKVVSDKIFLGIEADATEWTEITEEEKTRLENEWNNMDFSDATEQDYQDALAEMGVDLNG